MSSWISQWKNVFMEIPDGKHVLRYANGGTCSWTWAVLTDMGVEFGSANARYPPSVLSHAALGHMDFIFPQALQVPGI